MSLKFISKWLFSCQCVPLLKMWLFEIPVSCGHFLLHFPMLDRPLLYFWHLLPSVSIISKAQDFQDMAYTLKVKASFLLSCLTKVLVFWHFSSVRFRSVTSNSETPWTAACQAPLSITNSRSLLKLVSMEPVMPSNHLILSHLILISYFHGNQAKNTLQAASAAGLSHKKGARAKDILWAIRPTCFSNASTKLCLKY